MTVSISRPVPVSFPPPPVRNTSQSFGDGTLAFAGKLEIEHSRVCLFFSPYRQKHPTRRASDCNNGGLFADARLKHVAPGVIGINSTRTERRQRWSQSAASWAVKVSGVCVCLCVACMNIAVCVCVNAQREGCAREMQRPTILHRG